LQKVIEEWYRTGCSDMRIENVYIGKDVIAEKVKKARPKHSKHSETYEPMVDFWRRHYPKEL